MPNDVGNLNAAPAALPAPQLGAADQFAFPAK